jgi:hypothetical protein
MDAKKLKLLKKLVDQLAKAEGKLLKQQKIVDEVRQEIQWVLGVAAITDKPKAKPAKTGGKRAARGAVGAAINQAIGSGKHFGAGDIEKSITDSGASVAKGSINAGIGKLLKEKKIKRVERGVYVKA